MDTGSARSRFTIYGQRVFWECCIMDCVTGTFTSYLLELSSTIWTLITSRRWSHILFASGYNIYWMLLRRCRYYSMELLFSTCYIQVMSARQFFRQMSPSSIFVYIQGHATHQSTYLITLVPFVQLLFFLWHMCVMFHSVTCHCIF